MTNLTQQKTATLRGRTTHVTHITFSGNENHLISADDAIHYTEEYRRTVPAGSALAGFFGKETFTKLLSIESCVGIRIYFASQDDGTPSFVLAGVNRTNNDLVQEFLATAPLTITSPLMLRLDESFPADSTVTEHADQPVTLAEASRLTRNFRMTTDGSIGKGGFFGKNIFNKILSEPECVGIFVYDALRDGGGRTFVLAGVDRFGRHFAKWPFGEESTWCPPFCAPRNSLNS